MKKIAQSATENGLEKLLSEYFLSVITINGSAISNSKGVINGFSIKQKQGKFICYEN